jgi:hypothetical protein
VHPQGPTCQHLPPRSPIHVAPVGPRVLAPHQESGARRAPTTLCRVSLLAGLARLSTHTFLRRVTSPASVAPVLAAVCTESLSATPYRRVAPCLPPSDSQLPTNALLLQHGLQGTLPHLPNQRASPTALEHPWLSPWHPTVPTRQTALSTRARPPLIACLLKALPSVRCTLLVGQNFLRGKLVALPYFSPLATVVADSLQPPSLPLKRSRSTLGVWRSSSDPKPRTPIHQSRRVPCCSTADLIFPVSHPADAVPSSPLGCGTSLTLYSSCMTTPRVPPTTALPCHRRNVCQLW